MVWRWAWTGFSAFRDYFPSKKKQVSYFYPLIPLQTVQLDRGRHFIRETLYLQSVMYKNRGWRWTVSLAFEERLCPSDRFPLMMFPRPDGLYVPPSCLLLSACIFSFERLLLYFVLLCRFWGSSHLNSLISFLNLSLSSSSSLCLHLSPPSRPG